MCMWALLVCVCCRTNWFAVLTVFTAAHSNAQFHARSQSQAVGGNVAVALLLTVASNTLGVFTMPLLLPALLGGSLGGAGLESAPLLRTLVVAVLIPTALGAAARAYIPGACGSAARVSCLLVFVRRRCHLHPPPFHTHKHHTCT